ncbi:DNA-binding transcriptional regulator, GntR family [Xaviernesmea oryzae]|uniref:DNA-binding transcriptional regulator, GntR family n=1 Tax=Xaviernesmea oryzae TaxID=464029 RepID=A0A1X7E0J7_9HYPH|nr:GntR family transcriptional regulator [Xaviernesmea oryzae]SMF25181.1 DNA-binding transcriptional regulator, GntR family [Xaviernesmea oryzae]
MDPYEIIREQILSCRLPPGAEIFEQELAKQLGVSKSPIREALLRLRGQDLVDVRPRRGYRVRPISIKEATEMYELRVMYEVACVSRVVDRATDEEISSLKEFRKIPQEIDLHGWVSVNRCFHSTLADLSGNSRLARVSKELIEQFDRFTFISGSQLKQPLNPEYLTQQHAALIEAIEQRSKRSAQAAIKEHIELGRRRTIDYLQASPIVS